MDSDISFENIYDLVSSISIEFNHEKDQKATKDTEQTFEKKITKTVSFKENITPNLDDFEISRRPSKQFEKKRRRSSLLEHLSLPICVCNPSLYRPSIVLSQSINTSFALTSDTLTKLQNSIPFSRYFYENGENIPNKSTLSFPLSTCYKIIQNQKYNNILSFLLNSKTPNITSLENTERYPPLIVKNSELGDFCDSYPYVYNGYRVNYTSNLCWSSILSFNHNEYLNIWTEILGIIMIIFILIYINIYSNIESIPIIDLLFSIIFLLSCIFRTFLSLCSHLFFCLSDRHFVLWWSIDHLSLCVNFFLCGLLFGYMSFYCSFSLFYLYSFFLFFHLIIHLLIFNYLSHIFLRSCSFLFLIFFSICVPTISTLIFYYLGIDFKNPSLTLLCLFFIFFFFLFFSLLFKTTSFPECILPLCSIKYNCLPFSHSLYHLFLNASFLTFSLINHFYIKDRLIFQC